LKCNHLMPLCCKGLNKYIGKFIKHCQELKGKAVWCQILTVAEHTCSVWLWTTVYKLMCMACTADVLFVSCNFQILLLVPASIYHSAVHRLTAIAGMHSFVTSHEYLCGNVFGRVCLSVCLSCLCSNLKR